MYHGTVLQDDGVAVQVRWDDGKIGWMVRRRDVVFNAFLLIGLRSTGSPLRGDALTNRMRAERDRQNRRPFA